jgi:L,D-peptidoglycan transpeptidase YkuD (ErfK/YbiS/YcfS/YnhG family)
MIKKVPLLLLAFSLHASINIAPQTQQLLVVSSDGFTNNKATLQAYTREKNGWDKAFEPVEVNLGRNGLAWGEGLIEFAHRKDEPIKHEGDGKSPAGLFTLDLFFGYEKEDFHFPYLQADENTLCIDDSSAQEYNRIIQETEHDRFKSFEFMKRQDRLYSLGIVVGHNTERLAQRGSCIFIHIEKYAKTAQETGRSPTKPRSLPTAGCTSMQEERLLEIMQWLDKSKHPLLLQLPHIYLQKGFK